MPKRKYVHDVYARPLYGNKGGRAALLQKSLLDSAQLLQRLQLETKLDVHTGCVNTIVWNESGSLLLSGSDDHNLVITDIFRSKPVSNVINTPHTANIISAQFFCGSSDAKLVSCADSTILCTDVNRPDQFSSLNCHSGKVYEVLSVSGDPNSFLSCGEDGSVRWVDTRVHPTCTDSTCQKEIILECDRGVGSIALNPVFPWELAVGTSDSCVRMYDRRMLSTKSVCANYNSGLSGLFSKFSVPEFDGKSRRITSVKYRPDGRQVLVSFSSDYLYVFNPKEDCPTKSKRLKVGRPSEKWKRNQESGSQHQTVKKFRLRGDWSDTGPRSRPESEAAASSSQQAEPRDRLSSQAALMQRMTFALSRMLNDPGTRLAMQRLGGTRSRNDSRDQEGNENQASGEGNEDHESQSSNNERDGTVSTSTEPEPQSLEASSASLIQERWRQYRERKAVARRDHVINVETTNDGLAQSFLSPQQEIEREEGETVGVWEQEGEGVDMEEGEGEEERREVGEDNQEESGDSDDGESDDNDDEESDDDETDDQRESQPLSLRQLMLQRHGRLRPQHSASDNSTASPNSTNQQTFSSNSQENNNESPLSQDTADIEDTNDNTDHEDTKEDEKHDAQASTSRDENEQENRGEANDDNVVHEQRNERTSESLANSSNIETQDSSNIAGTSSDARGDRSSNNLEDLETSYSDLVESGVQPNVQLRYSAEGANTSSVQVQSDNLPGPMRVLTSQGQVGVDPVTGARRRRIGVSSAPTGSILPGCWRYESRDGGPERESSEEKEDKAIVEYESDISETDDSDDEESETGGRTILQPPVANRFTGHRNVRTLILEGAWWGNNYVLSGSDCGHFFAWDRESSDIVLMREADRHVVNRVRPHPFLPILASSGIDHDVKIWAPTSSESNISIDEDVSIVTRRNEVMLEETRDTITVPASLMIRMLASLNQIRLGEQRDSEARNQS